MCIALTIGNLPIYPHLALPDGYTPALVADSVVSAQECHEVSGAYPKRG